MKFQKTNSQISRFLYRISRSILSKTQKVSPCSSIVTHNVTEPMTAGKKTVWQLCSYTKEASEQKFKAAGRIAVYSIFCTILLFPLHLFAQDFTRTIERTARFADATGDSNELKIYNIQGSVSVEGYEGDDIRITARQEIEGTEEEITRAREELKFIVDREGGQVLIYIDAPFIELRKERGKISYRMHRWDEDDYDFLYDITVQVPRRTGIYASTINKGNVSILNTSGTIEASNVNGSLNLQGISGRTTANTVNGDITIRYSKNPAENSHYQTINGTIDVRYPDGLSADIRFKSLHGELYTDFRNTKRLQARVETDRRKKKHSTRYKIDRFAPIQIGNGGPTFSFEVLNGDVYIKRIQS